MSMNQLLGQARLKPDIIRNMRMEADRGASAFELIQGVQAALKLSEDKHIPVLWYFMEAFALSLPMVLPLREWMGHDRDEVIDAKIMANIASNRLQWSSSVVGQKTA
jgi:hypothetical protein